MKKESENLFFSTADISNLHFSVFASTKGIKKILINSDDKEIANHPATKLQNDDPYLFGIFNQLNEYFEGKRKAFNIPLDISGTGFQMKVWEELLKIPFGKIISYKNLSEKIGDIKAVRAVGRANGANPVPVIIPCHRVINSDGSLGGYSCGIRIKEKLLETEGSLSLELF